MNTKHQELIAEKVAEFIKLNGVKLSSNYTVGDVISLSSLNVVLTQTLQDTIDTVVAAAESKAFKLAHYAEHSPACFLYNAEYDEYDNEKCDCGLKEALTPINKI